MSGPPPCTTMGFRPTYFSSTTSRANSSHSSASSIAAPPYLITTVLEWNSLMYGSASSSVPTSRIEGSSRRVLGVDPHVLVRQVGEENLGLRARAVGHEHDRERAQQRVERLAEAQLVLAALLDVNAAGARAHQDRRVIGGQLAVNRGALEGALDAHAQQQLRGLGRQSGVGLQEAQHRGEARRDHPRSLALGA